MKRWLKQLICCHNWQYAWLEYRFGVNLEICQHCGKLRYCPGEWSYTFGNTVDDMEST